MTDAALGSEAALEADARARRQALDPESFIVEAPAGAGKTELIAQRFLRLLGHVENPEEIVALTFTRKAAAEMRNRILSSLELAATGVPPDAPHRRITFGLATGALRRSTDRGWDLLAQPQRLRVMTLDSLCASLVRQMPLLSRMGSQPSITEDPEPLYRDAAARTLALLEDEEWSCVETSLAWVDHDASRLQRLIMDMLARRDQWNRYASGSDLGEASATMLRRLVGEELEAIAAQFPPELQVPLMPLARFAAGNEGAAQTIQRLHDWTQPLEADLSQLPQWRAVAALILTQKGTFRSRLDRRQGFPAGSQWQIRKVECLELIERYRAIPGLEAWLARVTVLPDPDPHLDERDVVESLVQVLRLALAQLLLVFREERQVDFIEMVERALEALGDHEGPTDLALRLDYRLQHLLIDEFQDTSPVQIRLLEQLTAGWEPGDGRTLFCVGDPMQSVYRFRKADVGLFLQAAEHGIGDLRLTGLRLSRNNRSSPEIVDWVNDAFVRIFPPDDHIGKGNIRYRACVATRDALPSAGVRVHPLVGSEGMSDADLDSREADVMLDIIRTTWEEDPGRRIAVLVRARTHLEPLIARIRSEAPDLRFQAVEIEKLGDRQWIVDLMTLLRALTHRADRIAWLALLRAPWCGLTLADLFVLAGDDRDATIWELLHQPDRIERLSADGRRRIAPVLGACGDALAQAGRVPVGRWIENAWLRLGGPELLPDAAAGIDVEAWFSCLNALVDAGPFTQEALEAAVDRLYASPDTEADGRLSFMTIHKAKGLEFDTVIVPGLHRPTGRNEVPLLRWEDVANEDGGSTPVVAPYRTRRRRDDRPSAYDYLSTLDVERGRNEELRVLYVAATRAQRALHWIGVGKREAAGALKDAPGGSLLSGLWPVLAAAFDEAEPLDAGDWEVAPARPSWEAFRPPLVRLVQPGEPAGLGRRRAQAEADGPVLAEDSAESQADYPVETAVGILVHRYLELFARSNCEGWNRDRLQTLRPAVEFWWRQRGFDAADTASGVDRTLTLLEGTLNSHTARWILGRREEAASEWALASRHPERGVRLHVVDRSFVEDGIRWIVDFKTARLTDPDAPDAFRAHAERYRPQLERYASLFQHEGRDLRLAIYYVAHDRLETLERPT